MAKFVVEGSTLIVRFSLPEMATTHRRTLRIPVSQVESVSAEPRPEEWLSQYVKFGRSPFPKYMDDIAGAAATGPSFGAPEVTVQGWANYVGDDIIKLVGPPWEQVYARFNPRLPALRVDLKEAAPYVGFLVAHRNPEAAAADLRAAIHGRAR
jgi:hypothetical protein